MNHIKDRTGEFNINKNNELMTILKYRNARDIDIVFKDGTIVKHLEYSAFKNGQIKNPKTPTVFNVGYLGVGCYSASKNNKPTKIYNSWVSMLQRCYDKKLHEKHNTYLNCTVDTFFHNFQNFSQWYYDNLWHSDFLILDKDILQKGNKVYSPNTCILVNRNINCLFTKSDASRGEHPIGVSYVIKNKKYSAQVRINNKNKHIGLFNTPEEAFYAYKNFKEKYIKQVADEYKEKYPNFPQKLYDAMYNWRVEITD